MSRPLEWCQAIEAVPGSRGEAKVPITPWPASASTTGCGEEALEHRRVGVLEQRRDRDLVAAEAVLDQLARRRVGEPQVVRALGAQRVADAGVEPDVLAVAAAVGVAELRHRAVLVDPLRERAAVVARDGHVGVLGPQRDQLVAVAVQRELLDHERVQQPGEVGAGRDREARPRLLERARAADLVAALEHEHAAPGAGEVGGGGQPVVARADDDGVPAPGGQIGGRHAPDPKRPLTFSDRRIDRLYFVSTWLAHPHSARTPVSRSG